MVAAIFFAAGIISSKIYQSEIRILLMPRSEVAARNIDQILRNAEEIPKSLSFYNKMLELNTDIEDDLANLPDGQRKDSWNDKIRIESIKKSGIIKINILDDSQSQAEIISRQVAQSETTVLGKYYNVADLDTKIIDGPIASSIAKIKFWVLFPFSLFVGLLTGLAAFLIAKLFSKDESFFKSESLEKYFQPTFEDSRKKISEYFSAPKNELKSLEEDTYTFEKKAVAPDNLPIAAEESVFASENKKEQSANSSENVNQIITREATPEEVKARLNKLLNS